MMLGAQSIWLYAGAMLAIWLTPGPVWVAIMARALSGGWAGVWPLAIGVAIGDALWPLIALFGLAMVVSEQAALLAALRWVAALVFVAMGAALLAHARRMTGRGDSRLTRPGLWAGFSAGLLAITGNPKAALFYVTVLPGFFDVGRLTRADVAVIVAMSALIPLALNLGIGAAVTAARARLATPRGMMLMNLGSGLLLVAVGLAIAATNLAG